MSSCTITKSTGRRGACVASVRWYMLGREVTCLMLQFLPAFANNNVMCSSLSHEPARAASTAHLSYPRTICAASSSSCLYHCWDPTL